MNEIYTRRSVRKYQDKLVEKEKVTQLFRAGMQAPSAGNQQPWEFLIVEDKKMLEKLSKMSPYSGLIADAPMAIILLGNSERMKHPQMWEQDMGACTQNILLEAVKQGLGTVWIGVAPLAMRMAFISDIFELPETIKPFAIVPVGYPSDDQENKFVDRFDETRVRFNKY